MVNNYNKEFKPELTPKQMLEYGVFGGSYLGNTIHEYPKSWFPKAKLSKTFDVNLNNFQIQKYCLYGPWERLLISLL